MKAHAREKEKDRHMKAENPLKSESSTREKMSPDY